MRIPTLIRLSAIHVSVGLTLLPIDSTLNRIMITELGISATLVALLVSVPYLLSPMQLWIGSLGERRPIWGYHRSPYIIIGLFLCAFGAASSPTAAFAIYDGLWWGVPFGFVAFGAWGFGFNFATVSYLALATELSRTQERYKTVGVMWFVLILSMIIGGISFSRAIEPYSHERLITAFIEMAGLALGIGLLGVIGLERRGSAAVPAEQRPRMQVVTVVGWHTGSGYPARALRRRHLRCSAGSHHTLHLNLGRIVVGGALDYQPTHQTLRDEARRSQWSRHRSTRVGVDCVSRRCS